MKLTEREIRLLLEGLLELHETNSEVTKLAQRLRDELARKA
jgi:hypothetical protein